MNMNLGALKSLIFFLFLSFSQPLFSQYIENNKAKVLKVSKPSNLQQSKIAGNFFGWLSLKQQKKISNFNFHNF